MIWDFAGRVLRYAGCFLENEAELNETSYAAFYKSEFVSPSTNEVPELQMRAYIMGDFKGLSVFS